MSKLNHGGNVFNFWGNSRARLLEGMWIDRSREMLTLTIDFFSTSHISKLYFQSACQTNIFSQKSFDTSKAHDIWASAAILFYFPEKMIERPIKTELSTEQA